MSNLAILLPNLDGGGTERVMLNLAQGFIEQGIKVDLVLVRKEGSYLSQVPPQVRLVVLGNRRLLLSIPALARYLLRERPKTILCGQEDTNMVALWVKRTTKASTRIVVGVHNTLSRESKNATLWKRKLTPFLVRCFYPWADAIVAVSRGVAEDLAHLGLSPSAIEVIYNPVVTPSLLEKVCQPLDCPWFSAEEIPVILGVGRLEKQKDFPTLIRAFAQVQQQCAARLVILGEGPERNQLEALAREMGLAEKVAFPGFVSNPYAYMAKASVCVLSSIWEGLPTVLIEAMAAGTPVVSTDCKSGPAEILANGRYGKLVAVKDVQGMAEAIISTLKQPQDRAILQQRAIEFSLEKSLAKYLKVLNVE